LERDLIQTLLQPPDPDFARELVRDLGKRLKHPVPLLLIADALQHLAPRQRGSSPRDRTITRRVLLERLQRPDAWLARPITESLPARQEVGVEALPNGPWTWRTHSLVIITMEEARWGVLHLWLRNDADDVGVGQPTALVLADATESYAWSPLASARVPSDGCPAGCSGSLASVAVEPQREILGHLAFALPDDATPARWGLLDEDLIELRACEPAPHVDEA
jgi:hypothetical protein